MADRNLPVLPPEDENMAVAQAGQAPYQQQAAAAVAAAQGVQAPPAQQLADFQQFVEHNRQAAVMQAVSEAERGRVEQQNFILNALESLQGTQDRNRQADRENINAALHAINDRFEQLTLMFNRQAAAHNGPAANGRGQVVEGRYQPIAGGALPAVGGAVSTGNFDYEAEYKRMKAEGADIGRSDAASSGLRPNNWMLPNSIYTVESLSKKSDTFVANYPAYDRSQIRLRQYHRELRLNMESARIVPLYREDGTPANSEFHRVAKMILYQVYKKSRHCGSKLFDMHPAEDDIRGLSVNEYEALLMKKFVDPNDQMTAQTEYRTYKQGDYQEVSEYLDEKWARFCEVMGPAMPDPCNPPQHLLVMFRHDVVQGIRNPEVRKSFQNADPERSTSIHRMREYLRLLSASEFKRMTHDESPANTYKGLYAPGRAGPWDRKREVSQVHQVEDVGAVGDTYNPTPARTWRASAGGSNPRAYSGLARPGRISSGPYRGKSGQGGSGTHLGHAGQPKCGPAVLGLRRAAFQRRCCLPPPRR